MRMNRGTITLVVVALIVIVGVILLNNYQENNPGATPTGTPQTGGPLFPDLTADTLTRILVRDNNNGTRTILVRNGEGLWQLGELSMSVSDEEALESLTTTVEATEEATEEATAEATAVATAEPQGTTGTELDQTRVQSTLDGLIALSASDRFDSDQLEGFELNQPAYSIYVTTTDDVVHVLHIGGENPSGNRYYVVQEQFSGDEVPLEAEGGAIATVIVEPGESLGAPGENVLGGGSTTTEEAAAEATEVEDVAEAEELGEQIEATNAAVAETMSEGTAEATPADETATEDATTESTTEATPEVGTTLALPTPTPALLAEPLVTLSGTQTINTVPKTAIDQLIGYITFPPYFVPTPTPTLPIMLPEVTEEATIETSIEVTPEATEEPTTQPTRRATATVEPTEEATDES